MDTKWNAVVVALVCLIVILDKTVAEFTCDCNLYSPSKKMITRIGSLPRGECLVQPNLHDDPCTCQEKAFSCLNECARQLSFRRLESTTSYWQRRACAEEKQWLFPPGLSMLAGVALEGDDECPSAFVYYQPLPSKPLCCRATFGSFAFDTACKWK